MSARKFGIIFTAVLALQLAPVFVSADAWWGYGARDKDWILKRGGTLIHYEIKGAKNPGEYSAKMYLLGKTGAGGGNKTSAKAGDLIETESGISATFDDAINNKYRIKIYQNNSLKMSTDVTAHPGEIINLVFDLKKGTVEKKTKVVYKKNQIVLNSDSSKYISPVGLDVQKPIFTVSLPEILTIQKDEKIEFKAIDRETEIDYYKIKLLDKKGHILRNWGKQSENYYFVPEEAVNEVSVIIVRAYDQAENYAEVKSVLRIVESKPRDASEEEYDRHKNDNDDAGEERQGMELSELDTLLAGAMDEIKPLESKIEQDIQKANRKNIFVYLIIGPSRRVIERVEEELEEMREKIAYLCDLAEQTPADEMKSVIQDQVAELEEFLGDKENSLSESRDNLRFWRRVNSLFSA